MADALKQAGRLMSLKTPLGDDVLCIDRATITEGVSKLFGMQFDLLAEASQAPSIKYDQIVGKPVDLTVELPGEKTRHFHGLVSRFSHVQQDERFAYYRAEVVPWLWLLSLTSDSKVFQDLKFPEIIEKVFTQWQGEFPDLVKFENKLTGSYTTVDYCVQYRETDFAFVSRLMEQEGIFYFFKHEEGKHTLVLGDSDSAFAACPNMEKARFLPEAGMGEWEDGVSAYSVSHSMIPGKYVLGDYHFQMSNKQIRPSEDGAVKIGNNAALELFEFPGEFAQRFNQPDKRLDEVEKHAKEIVKWRMEEQRVGHLVITGNASARAFSSGCFFSLEGNAGAAITVPGTQGKYVLTSVKHSIEQNPDYDTGASPRQAYRNSFSCIPHEVQFRPARTTPRPAIQGMQTAVVVGLKDEEIDCDKYGRVKVQFHWDREGKKDEDSSCWIRVGSLLAGKQWGMIHIPRIGQEVIVAFLEGDPDQPLIVGSVYNYDNMPPYDLPDNKTQSGLKTRSTKEGDNETFNELRFEDMKDKEHIYFHAQRNFVRIVENHDLLKVGKPDKNINASPGDQVVLIHNTQKVGVGLPDEDGNNPAEGNRWVNTWNNDLLVVGSGQGKAAEGDQKIDIWNSQHLLIGTGKGQAQDGSQLVTIYKDRKAELETGNDSLTIKMGNQSTAVKMGNQTTKLSLGKSETEALQSIELKVGQSSIKIDQMGVTIKGMMIKIEGTLMSEVKGLMTNVKADAILQVKGGLTMIN
ncbi:MAG: type VI secretion system tip protein TssI/VgrG [Pirellulaceae bacterium]